MSGRRGPGPISQLISLALAVALFGGWWLYNGGTNGGFEGCWRQTVGVLSWVADRGKDAWEAVFNNNNGPGTPTPTSPTTHTTTTGTASSPTVRHTK